MGHIQRGLVIAITTIFFGFWAFSASAAGITNGGFENSKAWKCTNCGENSFEDLVVTSDNAFKGKRYMSVGLGIGAQQTVKVPWKQPVHAISFYHISLGDTTVKVKNARTGKLIKKQSFSSGADWTLETMQLPPRANGKKIKVQFSNNQGVTALDKVSLQKVKWTRTKFVVSNEAGDPVEGLEIEVRDAYDNVVPLKKYKNGKTVDSVTTNAKGKTPSVYVKTDPKYAQMCTVASNGTDCLDMYEKGVFEYGQSTNFRFSYY